MKVFVSWSGARSHRLALALRDFIPSVLQTVAPYVSSEDIDKGARWSTDISKELAEASFGIICVTPENANARWLNFEAGALSKSLDLDRVAPVLFGVEREAIHGPLLQFQSTLLERGDIRKLLASLNRACAEHRLDESRLDDAFEVWWPRLEARLADIGAGAERPPSPSLSPDDAARDSWLPGQDHLVWEELLLRWEIVRRLQHELGSDLPPPLRDALEALDGRIGYLNRRRAAYLERKSDVPSRAARGSFY
jgi:hypothetical protein